MKIEEIKRELNNLINQGVKLADAILENNLKIIMLDYECWYSKSLIYIKKLNNDRVNDFKSLYKLEKRKEIRYSTYTISDALNGVCIPSEKLEPSSAYSKMIQQVSILKATKELLETKIYQLQELLQADIFDSELNSAKELNNKGFYRAAGAICGVVLEEHFSHVIKEHGVVSNKKNLTINDYNELLKNNSIIDTPTFRQVQLLGDIRNLCDHKKSDDPKKQQIEDLISGTEKIIKTVF